MDKYLLRPSPSSKPHNPNIRPRWKRSLVELNGRCGPNYRHEILGLLTQSYSQGIYLASVTKLGCLTIHDFENLYCPSNQLSPGLQEDEKKQLLHISTHQQLDIVRWNITNQDEVACSSMKSNELLIFDIGYVCSKPVQVLRKKHMVTVHGHDVRKGLSDIAFMANDGSRLLASDSCGVVSVWDRRMSTLPCLELGTGSGTALNSIQLHVENQIVFGAGQNGIIYMWDLRGGRTDRVFQSHKEGDYRPLTSLKLATMLEKIEPLKAQSNIINKGIHSINFDPSCPYRLAFHLDDGWSGALDIHTCQVTHIHCPPPSWLNDSYEPADLPYLRKPTWLSAYSSYVVGSSSDAGIYILDFYPDPRSPCHVDYNEEVDGGWGVKNRFVPLTESVTAVAAHPLDATIVAGTKLCSLLVISQRRRSCQARHCPDCHEVR